MMIIFRGFVFLAFFFINRSVITSASSCYIDLGFIIDDSSSITDTDFQKEIGFVKSVASQFNIGTYYTRTSLITYSDDAKLQYAFRDYYGYSSYGLNSHLQSMRRQYGGTRTEKALDLARTSMFTANNGKRDDKPNILMIITDGNSQSGSEAVQRAAKQLSATGVNIFAIGVGTVNIAELRAIASDTRNIFQVSSASYLSTVVNRVKQISCSRVSCSYRTCTYGSWNNWSGICGDVKRTRSLVYYSGLKSTYRTGGCAGLAPTCGSIDTEYKTLNPCRVYTSLRCQYKDCSYYSWSSWSATCGVSTRTRNLYRAYGRVITLTGASDCSKYSNQQSCKSPQSEQKTLSNCPMFCKYKDCYYTKWSSWSATCGSVKRTRRYSYSYSNTVQVKVASDCDKYMKTCSATEEKKTLSACPLRCSYKECSYYKWSAWSATCGSATRTRRLYKAYSRTGIVPSTSDCTKYATMQSCQSSHSEQKDLGSCPIFCKYKTCYYTKWSSWSATCGSVKRTRKYSYSYSNTVQVKVASDCDKYTKTCSATEEKKTLSACPLRCSYKECSYYKWSAWSATCGSATRTRRLYKAYSRTGIVPSTSDCTKYATMQSCQSSHSEQKDLGSCPIFCKYKTCYYTKWSSWSATCGSVKRTRKYSYSYSNTVQVKVASDCDKYTKTCSATEEKKTLSACPLRCSYKECSYYKWSAWSATCGSATRTRKLYKAYSRTGIVPSTSDCTKYATMQSCQSSHSEQKDLGSCPIKCPYKECSYYTWSSWSASCGTVSRTRKLYRQYSKIANVAGTSNCDKYSTMQSCKSPVSEQKILSACPIKCPYKQCSYYSWSSWSASCGTVSRTRKLYRQYSKTATLSSTSNCDKYSTMQSCKNPVSEQKTLSACPIKCPYKQCSYYTWSSWSASCGTVSRTRKLYRQYSKTATLPSTSNCDKYSTMQSCKNPVSEQKTLSACPIKCPYKQCSYYSWSSWSASCGTVSRTRKLYRQYSKTATLPSTSNCDKYSTMQSCKNPVSEQKTLSACPIKCPYKQCSYYSWSSWSASCGTVSRTRKLYRQYSKTATLPSTSNCDKYSTMQSCKNPVSEQKTLSACPIKCPYKQCSYYSWSSWSASCGTVSRTRKLYRQYSKTATLPSTSNCNKYSTMQSCKNPVSEQKILSACPIKCPYKQCSYYSWSSWSASCGTVSRTRKLYRQYSKTATLPSTSNCDKYSTMQSCKNPVSEQKTLSACPIKCPYKQCSYYSWSSWSASCGTVSRARKLYRQYSKTATVPSTSNCDKYSTMQSCKNPVSEQKTLSVCPITCQYKECHYKSQWSSWSVSCGNATRTKQLQHEHKKTKKVLQSVCDTYIKVCDTVLTEKKALHPCIPKRNCVLDLGVVLDESSSISDSDFTSEKRFIKHLTNSLTIGVTKTRVSVFSYSTSVRHHSKFRDYTGYNKDGLDKLLDGLKKYGGSTATEKALKSANGWMFTKDAGTRDGVSKVLIIITDGKSNEGTKRVQQAANVLKKNYVNMFAVGVGKNVKNEELYAMASSSEHVLLASSFTALSTIMNKLQDSMCEEKTCKYKECFYHAWSLWSTSCGPTKRTRKLSAAYDRVKTQHGGCTGLVTSCKNEETEEKQLPTCPLIPTKECKLDLGAILDESTSIQPALNFRKETDFIKDVTRYLTIGPSNTRVSVITFSTEARLRFHFNEYEGYNRIGLNNALDGLKLAGGNTATEKALDLARTEMFSTKNGKRDGVSKVLLVITDGNSQAGSYRVGQASALLKAQGINVFAIGVGNVNNAELRAIATDSKNIYKVGNLVELNSAVNNVRLASCAAIKCNYKECDYSSWSNWSATCGVSASRNRKLQQSRDQVVERYGGCAGLNQTCESKQQETKKLDSCNKYMVMCKNYTCTWGVWSQYSSTCGHAAKRTRYMKEEIETKKYIGSCPTTLNTTPCSKDVDEQTKSSKCPCRVQKCDWYAWSSWSSTCGDVTRSRNLRRYHDIIYHDDCVKAQEGFGCNEMKNNETQNANKNPCMQECKYAECEYNQWSTWSGTCGTNSRSRDVNTTMKTTHKISCDGLKKDCSSFQSQIQGRREKCPCSYVECKADNWSAWSTSCGKGSRSRNIEQIPRTIEKYTCTGLKQVCAKRVQTEQRDELCECNYVECESQAWSGWSASCGNATRSRNIIAKPKTVKKLSCDGLRTSCPAAQEKEKRALLCNCKTVRCSWNSWTMWSVSCGNATRSRSVSTDSVTVQAMSCDGLKQSCQQTPQIENKKFQCPCTYTSCKWLDWSSWSATCGDVTRSRLIEKSDSTIQAYDCDVVKSERGCKEIKTSEQQTISRQTCTQECNYVECSYNNWSSWSSSCGLNMTRSRMVKTTLKTKWLPTCDGLTKDCSSMKIQVQDNPVKCNCDHVACVPGQWSSWSSECGKGSRSRNISTVQKKIASYNCEGLRQTCDKPEQVEERETLCTCKYVECIPAAWSSWSATCGKLKRTRAINSVQKTIQQSSCDGLLLQCPTVEETEDKDVLCPCKVAECSWNEWTAWSATCGDVTRVRTMSTTLTIVQKLSCTGLTQQCTDKPESEKRSTKCPPPPTKATSCRYVECVPSKWSGWSSKCGEGERTRNIQTVVKSTMKASCAGLQQKCPKAEEKEERKELCQCPYVECVPGQWNDWTTKCGKGKRQRRINVVLKTVDRYSCDGLSLDCDKEEEFEHRNELCECSTVDCVPGDWSDWSSECGQGNRSRDINPVRKIVKKYSCDGLQTTCPNKQQTEDRNKKCTCSYVECQAGAWSEWSNECGQASRSRPINTLVKTVEKFNCDGLQQTCAKTEETQDRKTKCTCNYVECQPAEWSAWSAQCGKDIKRTRLINVVSKTVQRESCDGLKTICEKAEEIETKDKLCTCNHVQCKWSAWGEPSQSCGHVTYERTIQEVSMTSQNYSCDGLTQQCEENRETKIKEILCKCNQVHCVPAAWTAWSSDCGEVRRVRAINAVQNVVEKISCEGLQQTCVQPEEVQEKKILCECSTVDCVPGDWSEWSSECGQGNRTRDINPVKKIVKKYSCDGLQTTCPNKHEFEDRNKKCNCSTVECQTGTWSEWSNECGQASRSRPINAVVKTVERYGCEGLITPMCENTEVEDRTTNCTCNYVECVSGEWSEWSAKCGNIKRNRIINVVKKTIQSESCTGLLTSCPKTEEVESQQKMCTCNVLKCDWSPWSQWSATCGDENTRERKIVGRLVQEKKLSCNSSVMFCTQKPQTETRSFKCPIKEPTPQKSSTCHVEYRSLGCYDDDQESPRPLPELILSERDPSSHAWNNRLINWKQWDSYHIEFICRCAAKAKELKYRFFSTQFYGECWSGPEAGDTYFRNGEKDYKHCIKSGYKPCQPGDQNCIGIKHTNFVYKLD